MNQNANISLNNNSPQKINNFMNGQNNSNPQNREDDEDV